MKLLTGLVGILPAELSLQTVQTLDMLAQVSRLGGADDDGADAFNS